MKSKRKWYKLDTSAKIYPALESYINPALFRMSIMLKKDVDEKILLDAMNSIKHRFPYFNVHLKKGVFWSYLEQNTKTLKIWQDVQSPCERIYPLFNNGYMYKIKYYRNKISIDIFHVLTDGYGAMEYLKCLVNEYLYLNGDIDERAKGIINIQKPLKEDEEQDAFLSLLSEHKDKLIKNKDRALFSSKQSFNLKGKHIVAGRFKVVTGTVDIGDIKKLSKQYDATITQILAAVYMVSLMEIQHESRHGRAKPKSVGIQIPVNMRSYYKTNCMRNFSLFVIPSSDPDKEESFEEIVSSIKEYMAENLTMEHLVTMAKDNTAIAANPFIRHIPAGIKNAAIRFIANTQGTTQFSGTLSNLGLLRLPDTMAEHVDSALFTLGPSTNDKCSCAVVGYNGKLNITFSRNIIQAKVSRRVFTKLVEMGVPVTISSNY